MIQGIVNSDREPIVQIVARNLNNEDYAVDVVVDTGFTGWLTLSPHIINPSCYLL